MEIFSAKRSFANESEGAGMAGCLGHNGAVLAAKPAEDVEHRRMLKEVVSNTFNFPHLPKMVSLHGWTVEMASALLCQIVRAALLFDFVCRDVFWSYAL